MGRLCWRSHTECDLPPLGRQRLHRGRGEVLLNDDQPGTGVQPDDVAGDDAEVDNVLDRAVGGVPDPLDPDIVYGGRVTRYDRRTRLAENISPKPLRGEGYRVVRTQPVAFSPADPRILYYASNTVWKTTNGGKSWTEISPDLTRKEWPAPANVGKYAGTPAAQPKQRGVVYALAPSPLDVNRLWAGTDDGLIHVTTNGGKYWTDVTPPALVPWAKVSIMDASHFNVSTAYAAINTFRLDDLRPHIYRTRDGGKSWTHITNGIPDGAIVNVVREDHEDAKACSSPAPRTRSTSPSTTATTGSRSASTCPPAPSATSSSTTTTSP